jgi:hypothetical protein
VQDHLSNTPTGLVLVRAYVLPSRVFLKRTRCVAVRNQGVWGQASMKCSLLQRIVVRPVVSQ